MYRRKVGGEKHHKIPFFAELACIFQSFYHCQFCSAVGIKLFLMIVFKAILEVSLSSTEIACV